MSGQTARRRGRRGAAGRKAVPDAVRRARKRRRLLLGLGVVVWVPLLVVGFLLATLRLVTADAIESHHAGSTHDAIETFEANVGFNLVERWKAHYDLGTAHAAWSSGWTAMDHLDAALERVPDQHRCLVQTNRAVIFEHLGDGSLERSVTEEGWVEEAQALVDAEEEYPEDAPWGEQTPEEIEESAWLAADTAAWLYDEALEARADPTCADDSQSPEQQEANQGAQDELEDKQDQAQDQAEALGGPGGEEEPDSGEAPATEEERQSELASRNAEAGAEAEAERQQQSGGGSGTDPAEEDGEEGDGDGDGEGTGGGTRGW